MIIPLFPNCSQVHAINLKGEKYADLYLFWEIIEMECYATPIRGK